MKKMNNKKKLLFSLFLLFFLFFFLFYLVLLAFNETDRKGQLSSRETTPLLIFV